MIKTMKSFLVKLFSDDGRISSKRVVGFGAFLLVVEIIQVALFGGKNIEEFLWWGLLGLITACFGLNTIINMKSNTLKNEQQNRSEDIGENKTGSS